MFQDHPVSIGTIQANNTSQTLKRHCPTGLNIRPVGPVQNRARLVTVRPVRQGPTVRSVGPTGPSDRSDSIKYCPTGPTGSKSDQSDGTRPVCPIGRSDRSKSDRSGSSLKNAQFGVLSTAGPVGLG